MYGQATLLALRVFGGAIAADFRVASLGNVLSRRTDRSQQEGVSDFVANAFFGYRYTVRMLTDMWASIWVGAPFT